MKRAKEILKENLAWAYPNLAEVLREMKIPLDTFTKAIEAADKVRAAEKEAEGVISEIMNNLVDKMELPVAKEQKIWKALEQEGIFRR